MKTKTFEDFKATDAFERDLKVAEDATEEELISATRWFQSIDDFTDIGDEKYQELTKIMRGKKSLADSFTSVVTFLLKEGHVNDDKVEDLLEDLAEMKLLKSEATEKLRNFLHSIWSRYDAMRIAANRSILPKRANWTVHTIGSVSNLRPVILNEYQLGTDKLETYEPKIEGWVGVASVRMFLTKEDKTEIVDFDLNKTALDKMIEMLQCAKIELAELEKVGSKLIRKHEEAPSGKKR